MLSLKLPSPTCMGTFLQKNSEMCYVCSLGRNQDQASSLYYCFFIFLAAHVACRILVPRPGIEPMPPAEVWRLNHLDHWGGVPITALLFLDSFSFVSAFPYFAD